MRYFLCSNDFRHSIQYCGALFIVSFLAINFQTGKCFVDTQVLENKIFYLFSFCSLWESVFSWYWTYVHICL